jgi:hypothetical protein
MKDWQLEFERLFEENSRLVQEIRHLRCAMVEAACSIDPSCESKLFKQLTGERDHFIDERCNPYPEHDDHVSGQYMAALTATSEEFGGYDREGGLDEFFRVVRER